MAAKRHQSGEMRHYLASMVTRFSEQYERNRSAEMARINETVLPGMLPLSVEITEFYARDNALNHHTDLFDLTQMVPATPVLRRGETFFMAVRFDRPYDPKVDVIRLIFNFGMTPAVSKETRVILPITDQQILTDDRKRWDTVVHRKDGATITFEVQISATAKVGLWHCVVQSDRKDNEVENNNYSCREDIYILFNPWCQEDGVYMRDEELRKEYVLNDVGKVWVGSHNKPQGWRWIFGQFDEVVLPVVTYLLELSDLEPAGRGDPIQMSRAISTVVNSNDDYGLLKGRWNSNFSGGVAPFSWTGSIAILEKYLKDGWTSVRFGQCWVFSALVVTVCRALGIPCRSVTNYVSAHDTNKSLTVDKYFRRDGEEIIGGPDGNCSDACWNFHVWNDVWMARPDLPSGYGGWQVIDATPQEKSSGVARCGPASVEAVRRGEVGLSYDTPFVFSEVNADLCHFQENKESDWGFSLLHLNKYHVGRRIVTKTAGRDKDDSDSDMEDITYQYKNPEGSKDERLAVMMAARMSNLSRVQYRIPSKEKEDVVFDLLEIDSIPFGQSFSVIVQIFNKSDEPRTISCVLSASSVFYIGVTAHRLKKAQGDFVVQPKQRETLKIQVSPSDYLDKLVDQDLVKINAIANVKETRQTWSEEDDFAFVKPKLGIQVKDVIKVGQHTSVVFSFQNPLPHPLTECSFSFEGPGVQRPKQVRYKDVKPGELVSFTEHFIPKGTGVRKLLGTFTSKQLSGIVGCKSFTVVV